MSAKVGLCLTGGGARGAYQVGAVQALEDSHLYQEVAAYAGTSIGAANAAVLATTSIEETRDIWFNLPDDALYSPAPLKGRLRKEKLKTFEHGIYRMDVFDRVMLQHINFDVLEEKEVYITISEIEEESQGLLELLRISLSHSLKKGENGYYFPIHNVEKSLALEVVKASCSIPFVFPPVMKKNKKYYDGGLFDNMPVYPLIQAGCTEIYVISISFFKQRVNIEREYPDIHFHIIQPDKSLGSILDFSKEHSKLLYDMGYNDTMKVMKKEMKQ